MKCLRRTPTLSAHLLAGLCVALVLVLAVLAASPAAHEWIHGHHAHAAQSTKAGTHNDADPDDDGCVVTLFAHGVVGALILLALAVAFFRLIEAIIRPPAALCLPVPRYWLPPLCGPPQS